eukprot:g57970.t1
MDTDLESTTEEEEEEERNTKRSQSKKRSRKGKAEKKNSKKSQKRGCAQDDYEDDAVNKRRTALLTKCLPAILPKLSDKPTQWKKWVAKVNQGRSSTTEGRHSFAKFDKWAASSCRGEDLTKQEQDCRWCLVRLLTWTVFPKILGTDRESVPTFRKLQTKHEFQTKRSAILAFLQAFTRTALPEVPFAFTTTHSLEAIEDLLEQPLVYVQILPQVRSWRIFRGSQDQGPSAQAEVATATENQEDLDQALEAKGGISHQKTGLMWQCVPAAAGRKIVPEAASMRQPALRLHAGSGAKTGCLPQLQGTAWDMTALDALPAPKHNQPLLPFTDVGEYLHCCLLFTVGSKKAYMEVRFRIFCASTAEFSFKLENKEEQTLPEKCMLAEVYEIRGAGAFSDNSTFAGMGKDECPRLIKRLREMWKGGDDYKRKRFTSTINAGKLNKVFHSASRLKRAMMAVDISSYAEEEPTDSNKVWYWRESVAWEMLPPLETRTDEDLQSYWDSDSEDEEELALTGRDMGRMFFLPMPGDQEWEKGYVVEYLRPPCLPVEVPTKEDSAGRKSLKDYKLIFTNVREKKDAYTGKVQDWDFSLGTEIFDDGVRQQHNGKRFAQESWDRVLSFSKRYNKSISYDCV